MRFPRRQLSLFLHGEAAEAIETLRRRLDPLQAALIPAHVTLCRDEETAGLTPDLLHERLQHATALQLGFGAPQRFDGHGWLLPCIDGAEDFAALRRLVLGAMTVAPQQAHITSAHPRSPRAAANQGEIPGPALRLRFEQLSLIEQVQPNQPWQCVSEVNLATASTGS